ncbi:hypothetical protein [Symbiopectobacterium sp. RP]|uniref:hypothetical protein n=1 Tax=Symbiopectobacterium sp. RP TaxID=3248553 RepID=UPI003D28658E
MQGIWWSICLHKWAQAKSKKKREWLRYRDFVLSPYGVIKIKSLSYIVNRFAFIALFGSDHFAE